MLDPICRRVVALRCGHLGDAGILRADVKRSAKRDRAKWLDDLAASGEWSKLSILRKGMAKDKGRLRSLDGRAVGSDEKAETLAAYFEKIQWRVRPVQLNDTDFIIEAPLPTDTGLIRMRELRAVFAEIEDE